MFLFTIPNLLGWRAFLFYVVAYVFNGGVNFACRHLIIWAFWKTYLRGHYLPAFLLPPHLHSVSAIAVTYRSAGNSYGIFRTTDQGC